MSTISHGFLLQHPRIGSLHHHPRIVCCSSRHFNTSQLKFKIKKSFELEEENKKLVDELNVHKQADHSVEKSENHLLAISLFKLARLFFLPYTALSAFSRKFPLLSLILRTCLKAYYQLSAANASFDWNAFWTAMISSLRSEARDNVIKDLTIDKKILEMTFSSIKLMSSLILMVAFPIIKKGSVKGLRPLQVPKSLMIINTGMKIVYIFEALALIYLVWSKYKSNKK